MEKIISFLKYCIDFEGEINLKKCKKKDRIK
jgi:hypothetical protein